MNLPDGWIRRRAAAWTAYAGDARADLGNSGARVFASVYGPNRASTPEAERDLERMVWALEGDVHAASRARIDALETWNAALASEVEKAQRQARLTEQALTAARAEIADLRLAAERRDARERARHPVVRRIAHALYVLRGVE